MASFAPDWHLTRDLETFLDRAGSFLSSQPVLHTVQLTVTDALGRGGSAAFGPEPPHFAWLTDRDGAVRATALRTPPYNVNLTATAPEAADALAAGADEVLLFTDLANPTGNALYQRIGYRPVRDYAVHTFRA